jgi:hypothetical protein
MLSFKQEGMMYRERALKIVLMLVGLLFTAMIYPLVLFVKQEPALAMMMSLYVTLGIFLIMAARNHLRIGAWSPLRHGRASPHTAVMSFQAFRSLIARGELVGVAVLVIIGVAFIVLGPAKQPVERASATAA